MTSYLIDFVLIAALLVTALRSGRMYRELRLLREAEGGLGVALEASEKSLNRAAEAVVAMKYEGVQTARSLDAQIAAAKLAAQELETLIARAEWHVSGKRGDEAAASFEGPAAQGRFRASLVD
ncbi:hypothetical protein [Aurantimonas sp. VKM B-3413]|uniref:hypothetical protein n=1 Tax=Aurantimonas sp. VKM B-3413 TaxID=2779401 RepID=UPI001E3FF825|nr:hypothetical protein [Aurantimonas sp. VKM B-3413]MCB8837935.1 hypothetical protein [Aurantimonas sp. VKM B-3413]